MKKITKSLVTLVAAITATTSIAGLAGCGKKVDYSKDVPLEAYEGGKVTVTFHHTMGQNLRGALDEYLPEFNKLFPNIKVEHTQVTGDYDVLRNNISTELTAGNSPTVAFCYPDHVALYNKAMAVAPLDGYIDYTATTSHADGTSEMMGFTAEQKADFYDIFYNEGKSYGDGKMYTLPFYKSTEVMYYNKTKFDELGLTPPKTWNEMETVCAALKAADPNCIPLGYDSEANWFITMTEQLGSGYTSAEGEHFVFDNEENHAFVEMLRGWYDKGYFTTKEIYNNYTSNLFTAAENEQRCYMCIGSTGGAAYQVGELTGGSYSFEIAVAQVPQASEDASKHKVIQQGPSVCLFKKADPQEVSAAWLFIKYFTTSVQFQGRASMVNGYTPVIKSVQENANYKTWLAKPDSLEGAARNSAIQQMTVKQAISQMSTYFTSPVFDGSSAARDEVGRLMQNCFVNSLNGKTASEFIKGQFADSMKTLQYEYGV